MKRAICGLLAACAVVAGAFVIVAGAEEHKQLVAAPVAEQPAKPPLSARPPLPEGWSRLPDGSMQLPGGVVVKPGTSTEEFAALLQGLPPPVVSFPAPACYFIRTIRPVSDDPMKTGFVPLQSRVTGLVRESDCAEGLGRTIPAVTAVTVGLQTTDAPPQGEAAR